MSAADVAPVPAVAGDAAVEPVPTAEEQLPDVPCPVCRHPMRAKARKCTECDEWRGWRRFVPASETGLSLMLALISILSVVGPLFIEWMWPDSETAVFIVASEGEELTAAISNTGRQPSVIRSYSVSFDQKLFPEKTEMGLTKGTSVLMPDKNDVITLNVKKFEIPAEKSEEINQWIKTGHVTLTASVKESNSEPDKETPREDRIEARQLEDWICNRIQWKKNNETDPDVLCGSSADQPRS